MLLLVRFMCSFPLSALFLFSMAVTEVATAHCQFPRVSSGVILAIYCTFERKEMSNLTLGVDDNSLNFSTKPNISAMAMEKIKLKMHALREEADANAERAEQLDAALKEAKAHAAEVGRRVLLRGIDAMKATNEAQGALRKLALCEDDLEKAEGRLALISVTYVDVST